ncbi:MAG: 3'(2'),5'-bisphosphate nucleotidase [Candidatus Omnitrophica bacterium]|nr:3'(2'),5'-bisphosphate nucleotidase [Candidatus Omnitrophota bacterium]
MIDLNDPQINFALDAVRRAAQMAGSVQRQIEGESVAKDDRSPVTVADFAIQAWVGHQMAQCFPQDRLVAEESSDMLQSEDGRSILESVTEFVRQVVPQASPDEVCRWIDFGKTGGTQERFWTLDPIDGTKGFIRGDHYAIALALIEKGHVRLAVLGCPHLDDKGFFEPKGNGSLIIAQAGCGTWRMPLNDQGPLTPLKVSPCRELAEACMLRSVEASHTHADRVKSFLKQLGVHKPPILMDSQAKYAVLAAGLGDMFFYLVPPHKPNFRMKIWDVAPGALVVEEAGGRVTDAKGNSIDYTTGTTLENNPGIVISNGCLHDKILNALNAIT